MNNRYINALSTILLIFAISGVYAADDDLKTEEEKLFYFIGTSYAGSLMQLNLSDSELELIIRGLRDAATGKAIELDAEVMAQKMQDFGTQLMAAAAEQEKLASMEYLEKMAAEDGAITTDSGIVLRELAAGNGKTPAADSVVKAHYHGTLRDGVVFDSSIERGEPFTASLGQVIPCWREAMTSMQEGGKMKVTCPSDLAYGDRGVGQIPAGSALTFEVELIAVVE